jgi:hypothetical protein
MNIADQFEQITIFLAEDGLIPVLEKMTASAVASVKVYGVAPLITGA